MHQEFRLRDLKGFRPTGASLRYSVTFLQIDLKKDTFYVLNNLLKGIYNDFTNACLRSKESDVSFQVSAQRRIVARLNVLVLISQRVFEAVRGLPHLRTPLLRSVYHILRLPLWHHNPSLRCAALRCLRYYVHSSVDVELLLECRLDLLIARCMDLSYYPTNFISSNGLSGNSSATSRVNSNPRTKFLVTSNPPISSTCNSSSCQLSEESSNHQLISNHYQSSGVLLKGTNATCFSRPPFLDTGHPIKSTIATRNSSPSFLSSFGERQIVLRLIYYITRLTPQLIPSSIIHAVAAPCLEVHRYLIANSNESSNKGDAHAASGVGVPAVVSRHIPRNLHHRIGDFGEAKVKISGFNDSELDTTIRGCLLILAELVILALERLILRTNPSVVNHSKIKLSYSNYYYYYCHYYYHYYYDHHHDVDHTNNHHRQFYNNDNSNDNNKSNVSMDNGIEKKLLLLFPLIGQIIIQALMTTFVCNNSTMHTYHSSRIHEAVILSLIAVLNRSEYAQLLPNSLISKFFVTFTSSSYFLHRSKLSFNVYPSFPICARNCLILLLRSWPGIFHFIHDGLPTLQTLLYTLGVGNTEIRNQILSLLYGLFPTIPIPHSSVKELEPTILGLIEALSTGSSSLLPVINLSSSPGKRSDYLRNEMSSSYLDSSSRRLFSILPVRCISSSSSSAWDIEGDFISAEGCRLLIKYDSIGIDLMNNYYAILLATLVEAGLYEALIRAVSDSNQVTSTRAGYLLGVLAYKVQSLLPQEHPACRRLHHAGLLHPETPGSQLAVLWLERIHRAMRLHETQLIDISNLIHVPLHSPFLECLAKQSANNISPTYYPLNPLQPDQMELTDTILDQLIASSNVLSFKSKSQHGRFSQCQVTTYDTKSPELWNWNILTSLGRHLAVTRCTFSWESKSHMKFLKAVMEFLIPDQTCRTGVSDCKTEKCTNPISPPVVYSIPSKSMQSSDGLLPVDGLLNAISDNRNFMLQNFITFNTHDNIDRLLVHSREKNISESNVTSTIMNNNSNTSRSNYLISPNANFNLAWLSYNWPHASAAGILAAGLITHLAHYPPASEPFQYLDRFLTALHLCLKFVLNKQSNKSLISHNHDNSGNNKSMDQKLSQDNNSIHNDSNNTNMILTFHSNYLAKSCGGLILFAASRLTNSEVGELRLEKSDLYLDFQSILMFPSQLKKSSNSHAETHYNDTDDKRNEQCVFLNHAKIILSSLDYSHSTKLSRLLLTTAVNSGVKPLRMYTIRLIRLLFRLKLPFLASWCIDLVVKLCMDSSNKIRRLALCLLEELCWDPVNVQALSQNILHNQTNDDNNNIVCQKNLLTPFAIYLLHGNTGPIGHRIFGRVLSITTIFDKLCMNHDILRQPNSSFLHCDYGCCCTPQTNKNCPNSCLSHDELNISNNGNNNKSVLSDPVNWMLDIARKYYNVAYAQEMDSRFTSLFVTYGTKLLSCASYKSTSFTYFDSAAINLQIPSPLNFNNNTDDEENSDRVDRPSNSEFNFEDNYFIEETDSMSGTYVSPSLVNDQSIGQVADGHDSFHCLPLPKHLYACIAEHRNGINLLDTRKDLETAVANMRSVLPQIINDKYEETNTFSDSNSLLKLKADMWALAHTCSTSYGQYWLLKHPELMTLFTSLALHSNSMNIRAVAWICLNLIATSSNQIFRHHNCLGMLQNDRTSKHINDLNCNESLSDWLFIPQIFYGRDVKTNEGAQDEMIVYPEIQSLSEQMVQTKLKPNRLLSDIFSVIPPVTNFGTETKNENLSLSAQKSVKSSVRNQVFENFNRSRRRLHRRWSPNHRRLSPPISESREHSSFHFMSFVKPKHSINSFTQIASFNYDVSYVNISSKKPYSTWTHRDCIPQRQVVSPVFTPSGSAHAVDHDDHELTDSKPNSNLDTRWLLQSLFHCVNKNQIIYLPTDIKILGFKKYTKNKQKYTIMNPIKSLQLSSSSLFDSKTNVSTKPFYNDNSHCLFRSLNSPDNNKHSISFIDVAVHVQLMLSLYSNDKLSTLSSIPDEVSTDTTNYTAKNNINQLSSLQHSSCDKENRLYSSRIQIADHSNSFLSRQENRTSEKSSLIFDEIHSVSAQPSTPSVLSSNQNYFEHENHELSISAKHSVEKLGAVDNWLVSSEVNETNLTKNDNVSHRLSVVKMSSEEYIIPVDVNQSPELSINDHHQLKNTNDHDGSNDNNNGWNNTENKANSSVHSNCLLPNTCLSYSCSLTNNDNSDSQCDQEMTEQDMWCNQLLDSISNLSSNVFSCSSSHDNNSNTLDEIIHKALITQKNFKGSIQLFNACTYTIIADLLGSYPFSRSIRTKIQSVFLYFELDELMVDANNSLIEVEKYLKSESKLTE